MSLVAQNGDVRIAYEVAGDGPPVLLVQGLGYGRWGWRPVVERLSDRFRVVWYDNRGIGDSDKPAGPYTASEMAADAAAVLDAAGIDRAHVVGASLGGMVAQVFAAEHRHRLDRLVLACTTPGGSHAYPFPEQTIRLMAEAAQMEPAVALRRFVENALAPGADEALVEEILALRVANPPDPAGWQAQAGASAAFDGFDALASIDAPTLVVHGTADNVVDWRNAQVIADALPNARVSLFDDAGHLLFWEYPDRFAAELTEFLT